MNKIGRKIILLGLFIIGLSPVYFAYAGTLSCTITTSCPSGVIIYRMSETSNAHGELPSQSNYSQLVCCTGVTGLGNSCSGTYATALKLSAITNAHAEENSQSNYAQSACIKAPDGGSVSVAYQANNCTGYDTTLGSITAVTNAHLGNSNAYTTKICATAATGGSLTINIVDGNDNSVNEPSIAFTTKTMFFDYQTSNGTFGNSNEKIRISNTTAGAQWTLTIAATDNSAALWSASTPKFDFNDSTANAGDGNDADTYGGQMSFIPNSATITPQSGCNTTGLSLGLSGAFSEGVDDSLTLLTAGSTAGTNCYWDLTGIPVSQSIPAEQTPGNYSINMTLTITAI